MAKDWYEKKDEDEVKPIVRRARKRNTGVTEPKVEPKPITWKARKRNTGVTKPKVEPKPRRSTETIMNEFNKPKLMSSARDKARKDARETKNVARRSDFSGTSGSTNKNRAPEYNSKPASKPEAKKQSFGSAFASARADGLKTFNYNGKKYTTERADDKKPMAKPEVKGNMGSRTDFSDNKIGPNMSAPKKAPVEDKSFKTKRKEEDLQRKAQRVLTGYKAGGKVSSASRRGDGCAMRGKTRA